MQHSSYKNSNNNKKALLIKQKIMTQKGQWLLRVTGSEYPPETCNALWVCGWAQNPSFSWMPWSVGMYWGGLPLLPSPLSPKSKAANARLQASSRYSSLQITEQMFLSPSLSVFFKTLNIESTMSSTGSMGQAQTIYHVLVQMPKEIQIGGGSVDFFSQPSYMCKWLRRHTEKA